MSPRPSPRRDRKVRSACQRCRRRRVKCDGILPSCSKCAKAGVPCIGGGATIEGLDDVPRAYLADSLARISWLEDLIRARLPDISLETAVSPISSDDPTTTSMVENVPINRSSLLLTTPPLTAPSDWPIDQSGTSRALMNRTVTNEAMSDSTSPTASRSTALQPVDDLALVSLGTGAHSVHNVHYLGASSGQYLTHLFRNSQIVADSEATAETEEDNDADQGSRLSSHRDERAELGMNQVLYAQAMQTLHKVLPPRAKCESLVQAFFSAHQIELPLLHRPSLMTLLTALFACLSLPANTPLCSDGWPEALPSFTFNGEIAHFEGLNRPNLTVHAACAFLLYVISISSHLQARQNRYGIDPKHFEDAATALVPPGLTEISLPAVQLIVLTVVNGFFHERRGNAWVLLHIGMAYAVDLGIHRTPHEPGQMPSTLSQMRRRTFLCLYSLDRYVSAVLGRPLNLPDEALELDTDTPVFTEGESGRPDRQFLDIALMLRFRWARLLSEIKVCLYRFTSSSLESTTRDLLMNDLQNRLDCWLAEAMQELDQHPDVVEKTGIRERTQIDYHYTVGLLHQPSLGHRHPEVQNFQMCYHSAAERLRHYWSLYNKSVLILNWPTTQGIFLAGMTMAYCVWSSHTFGDTLSLAALSADLRLCSSLLILAGEYWSSVRKASRGFQRLADLTIQHLEREQRSNAPLWPSGMSKTDRCTEQAFFDPDDFFNSFVSNDFQIDDSLFNFEISG